MLKKLSITFGPEKQLQEIMEDNKSRKMILLKSAIETKKYALVDISNENSIFHTQLDYQVYETINLKDWKGYFEFRYVTLDTEQQKIFDALLAKWEDSNNRPIGLKSTIVARSEEKSFEFLMINIWKNQDDYVGWENESSNEFNQFGHGGNVQPLITQYVNI